ncbi:hypothetical protein NMY22_g9975 [Coprinellus aureogranulatus]|nr:hypothetical protein NMY22_g9975 [Coprinellus aureogranulatus]
MALQSDQQDRATGLTVDVPDGSQSPALGFQDETLTPEMEAYAHRLEEEMTGRNVPKGITSPEEVQQPSGEELGERLAAEIESARQCLIDNLEPGEPVPEHLQQPFTFTSPVTSPARAENEPAPPPASSDINVAAEPGFSHPGDSTNPENQQNTGIGSVGESQNPGNVFEDNEEVHAHDSGNISFDEDTGEAAAIQDSGHLSFDDDDGHPVEDSGDISFDENAEPGHPEKDSGNISFDEDCGPHPDSGHLPLTNTKEERRQQIPEATSHSTMIPATCHLMTKTPLLQTPIAGVIDSSDDERLLPGPLIPFRRVRRTRRFRSLIMAASTSASSDESSDSQPVRKFRYPCPHPEAAVVVDGIPPDRYDESRRQVLDYNWWFGLGATYQVPRRLLERSLHNLDASIRLSN